MSDQTGLAAKLKELGEKATPDAWYLSGSGDRLMCYDERVDRGNEIGWLFNSVQSNGSISYGAEKDNAALIVTLRNNLPAIIAALEARPPATEGNPDEEVSAIERVAHKGGRDAFVQGHDRDVPHNYSKHGLSKLWLNGWDHEKALSAARPPAAEDVEDDKILRLSQVDEHGVAPDGSEWRNIIIDGQHYTIPYEVAMWFVKRSEERAALSAARPSREGELERLREERRDLAMSLGLPGDEEHSFEELANSAEQLARIAGKAAVRASREGEMRAALEPFALSGERDWDDDAPDATELWCCQGPGYYPNRSVLTVGDLRRARAALQPQQPGSSDA